MKRSYKGVIILLVIFSFVGTKVCAQKVRKVLIIGIDGTVWAGLTPTIAPTISKMITESYYASNSRVENRTVSANGWSALLTGVGVAKHKATANTFTGTNFTDYPSIFKYIKDKYPTLRTSSITSWTPINKFIISDDDITGSKNARNTPPAPEDETPNYLEDSDIETAAITELQNPDIGVLYVHFDDVDAAGHNSGFSPANPKYAAAITTADTRVQHILEALTSRPTYADEDWLIVLGTDHGGTYIPTSGTTGPGTGTHGGPSNEERNSFIILNNPIITPQVSLDPTSHNEQAVTFGSGMYGKLPTQVATDANFAQGNYTIELRVKKSTADKESFPPIISNKNWVTGANAGFMISDRSGFLAFNINAVGGTRKDINNAIDLTDMKWHYVAVTVNRTTKEALIYDGGKLVSTLDISSIGTGAAHLAACGINIGQDGTAGLGGAGTGTTTGSYNAATNNKLFKGSITHIRIFKKVLSPEVIEANFNNDDITAVHPDYADLVYYAKGNDGSGSTYVRSGGITVGDIELVNGTPEWNSITGKKYITPAGPHIENTVTFGDGNYAALPSDIIEKANFSQGNYTIELRVKKNNTDKEKYPPILSNKNWVTGANAGFMISDYDGNLRFNINAVGGTRADLSAIDLTDMKWHYVTITVNRTTKQALIYDAGKLVGTLDISSIGDGSSQMAVCGLNIGQDGTGGLGGAGTGPNNTGSYNAATNNKLFKGNITHIRIFNKVLDAAAIAANFNNDNITNTHPDYANLVYYVKGNDGSGSSYVKTAGTANGDAVFQTVPTWSNVSGEAYIPAEETGPYTYSVAPTVLRFLDISLPPYYDGTVLAGVTAQDDGALPVKVISFTGKQSQTGINLQWSVGTESNVYIYEVQRKAEDGKFEKITTIKAMGASKYSASDANPIIGVNYYRLKTTDNNGNFEITKPIAVNFSLLGGGEILYPNPVKGNVINLTLNGYATGNYTYKLVNTAGITVQQGSVNYGGSSVSISTTAPAGVYVLYLSNGSSVVKTKLVKE